MSVNNRLNSLGINLLSSIKPVGAFTYVPYRRSGNIVYVSGQLPRTQIESGEIVIMKGKVGSEVSVVDANIAARQCAISILSVLQEACDGNLDRVSAVLKVEGFVNAVDSFVDHPLVLNGCSDLLVEVFGPTIGSHARTATGCSSLPLGAPVEVAAIFEISD